MGVRRSLVVGFIALLVGACNKPAPQQQQAAQPAGPAPGTPEWKIQNAMSAAPAGIAAGATIVDRPSSPDGKMVQLRAGTNGWTCISDDPNTPGNTPLCWNARFGGWAEAIAGHKTPHIGGVALAYMLQGVRYASNTDPFAAKPDSGQPWIVTGPQIMVVVPDPRTLSGMPTDWRSGGPYVMYAGTPYAHLMVPVRAGGNAQAAGATN